jgi:hypothetical protein
MRRDACDTTQICVRFAVCDINLASAGNRSGCKLVSGSFRITNVGGRGVRSAAIHSRYRSVPSAVRSPISTLTCCGCQTVWRYVLTSMPQGISPEFRGPPAKVTAWTSSPPSESPPSLIGEKPRFSASAPTKPTSWRQAGLPRCLRWACLHPLGGST